MKTLIVLAALISSSAAAIVSTGMSQATEEVVWRQLLDYDVSLHADATARGPLAGAPGASCVGFRVNNDVQGGAIIVEIDRPALGVFVGLNTPNEFFNEPYEDLRVEFTLADGSTHTVRPNGGSGIAMLFHSPEGVAVADLRRVALYVDDAAEWAQ